MNYKRVFEKNSYIFITFVTHRRKNILIDNIECLRSAFASAKEKYDFEIFAIVIMPNHIHMIIRPKEIKDYPKIVAAIKISFTKNSKIEYTTKRNRESNIWQRRYWEHTIRDENDLYKHLDYIHYNPIKHDYVKKAKDWKYSSFKKFVRMGYYDENWCNFEDKNDIKKLDFE